MIRALIGRAGAVAVVALVIIALAIGGLAERLCRPRGSA
jgi:hypothetical protein